MSTAVRQRSPARRAAYLVVITFGFYLIAEVIFSALFMYGVVLPPQHGWFYEQSGDTLQFDPIRGYTLTRTPARQARLTFGEFEYVGTLLGNNVGFPDKDDFEPRRAGSERPRFAVFGDSFTAGQFFATNWPDAVERRPGASPPPELLNFSVSGGGLANWWSILTRHVATEGYELDALVFAVYLGNLHRGFSIGEHRGYDEHMFARLTSWNPDEWPRTVAEARPYLQRLPGAIVSSAEFDAALRGEFHPDLPRPVRPYLLSPLLDRVATMMAPAGRPVQIRIEAPAVPATFTEAQGRFIDDLAAYAERARIPVLVVSIPARGDLLIGRQAPPDVRAFAQRLGAEFVDGAVAFADLDEAGIRAHWFIHDAHWSQAGSNRFAAFIEPHLRALGEKSAR